MTMNNLYIAAGTSTPEVNGDWETGVLTMTGDSYPENSFELFDPMLNWVQNFLGSADRKLQLNLGLIYLNTSSIKVMMDLFDVLEEAHSRGKAVEVLWLYDSRNGRVAELAEEFQEDCSFPFHINAYEKN